MVGGICVARVASTLVDRVIVPGTSVRTPQLVLLEVANLTPLLVNLDLQERGEVGPLELWTRDDTYSTFVNRLNFEDSQYADVRDIVGDYLRPIRFTEIADDLGGSEEGRVWIGVPTFGYDELQISTGALGDAVEDSDGVVVEEVDGLPDGFMMWPIDDQEFMLLPSDSGLESMIAFTELTPVQRDVFRVSSHVVFVPSGGVDTGQRREQCELHIHRNREGAAHFGMCLSNADDPCGGECGDKVETVGGVSIAVDCDCRDT